MILGLWVTSSAVKGGSTAGKSLLPHSTIRCACRRFQQVHGRNRPFHPVLQNLRSVSTASPRAYRSTSCLREYVAGCWSPRQPHSIRQYGLPVLRDQPFTHDFQRLYHIILVSATGADDMCISIMHIVEIQHGAEVGIVRTCKEVETAVEGKDSVTLLPQPVSQGKHKYIVETCTATDCLQLFNRILHLSGVDILQVDAPEAANSTV